MNCLPNLSSSRFIATRCLIRSFLIACWLVEALCGDLTIDRDLEKAIKSKLLSYSRFNENQIHALNFMMLEGERMDVILEKRPYTKKILLSVMGYGNIETLQLSGLDPCRIVEEIKETCSEMGKTFDEDSVTYYVEKVKCNFNTLKYAIGEFCRAN